jgi:hypothetical protein
LWQVEVQKMNQATQEMRVDKSCALTEMVQAQVATYQQTYSVGAAIESTRNAMLARRDEKAIAIEGARDG